MENQKCQQCSAPMVLINKRDGTNAYVCEYCGYVLDIRPKTTSDKVFSFVNRAINALKDDSPIVSSPKQEEYDRRMEAVNEKLQKSYERAYEKRMERCIKYAEKCAERLGRK